MLELNDNLRFYIFNGKTNLRGGYMRMCATVREEMKSDPRDSRNVYVFINRSRTIIRMLHYERGFYVVYEKRPENGRFKKPIYDSRTGKTKFPTRVPVCLTEGLKRTEIKLPEAGMEDTKI